MAAKGEECSIMNIFHKSVQVPTKQSCNDRSRLVPRAEVGSFSFLIGFWLMDLRHAMALIAADLKDSIDIADGGPGRWLPHTLILGKELP